MLDKALDLYPHNIINCVLPQSEHLMRYFHEHTNVPNKVNGECIIKNKILKSGVCVCVYGFSEISETLLLLSCDCVLPST